MMIKLQDFARECGVTDRTIQKHVKKHEQELEGHFFRKGKNGTWLDEFAQDFIRNLMLIKPVAVADQKMLEELQELKARVAFLEGRIERKDDLIEKLQERVNNQDKELKLAAEKQELLETTLGEKEKIQKENETLQLELRSFSKVIGPFYRKK